MSPNLRGKRRILPINDGCITKAAKAGRINIASDGRAFGATQYIERLIAKDLRRRKP